MRSFAWITRRRARGLLAIALVWALTPLLLRITGALDGKRAGAAKLDPVPSEPATMVVLLVLDGVRWQEVFQGSEAALSAAKGLDPDEQGEAEDLFPTLHWMATSGGAALGAPGMGGEFLASGPDYLSMPGYGEIFAGARETPCHDNACRGTAEPTLVDSVEVTADEPGTAAVISSWAQIGYAASAGNSRPFVSCGRAVPALQRFGLSNELTSRLRSAEAADPSPGWGNYRPDQHTREIALGYLVERRPRFLFIGLGDTDELAHKGDYRGYLDALRAADEFAAELIAALNELEKQGQRWTLMITTDHGRGHNFQDHGAGYPESARSFMLAVGHGIASRGLVDLAQTRYLADIAPTVHRLLGMQLPSSGSGVLLWELLSWQ